MARVLTCIDEAPASDGTCSQTAYMEQPHLLPPLDAEQTYTLGSMVTTAMVLAYCFRRLDKSFSGRK